MKFSAAVWLVVTVVIGKTLAVGYSCYGGGKKVKSPKNNDMYVLDGVNGTCIAVMVGRKVTLWKAKELCGEEFPNGGQLMLKENKDVLFGTWERYNEVTNLSGWFLVGYGNTSNGSCTVVQPRSNKTLSGPDTCDWASGEEFICQYPFNYDCYLNTSDCKVYYTSCEIVYNFVWQPSDLDHNKTCSPGKISVNIPQEFCKCIKANKVHYYDPWSSWTSCSKTCAGGEQTISRNLSCDNFFMDDTWVKSCYTNVPCEIAISSRTSTFSTLSIANASSIKSTSTFSLSSTTSSVSSTTSTSTSSPVTSTCSTVTTSTSIGSSLSTSPQTTTVPEVEISTKPTSTISSTTSTESSIPFAPTNYSSTAVYTSTLPTSALDSSTILSTNYSSTTVTILSNPTISQNFSVSVSDDHSISSTFITDDQTSHQVTSIYVENDTAGEASSTFLGNGTVNLLNTSSTVSEEMSKDSFKDGIIITIVVALGVLGLFFMICGLVLLCSKKNRKVKRTGTAEGIERVKSPYCSTQESSVSSSSL